jgi:hypothetical protein
LKDKPVVMIWGMYTCPAFHGYQGDLVFPGAVYGEENKLIAKFSSKFHFIHMIGPEPHPIWPYANFDLGTVRMNFWSTLKYKKRFLFTFCLFILIICMYINFRQPQTYNERLSISVPPIQRYIDSQAIILVDSLDGEDGEVNNPVWCSYSHGAR